MGTITALGLILLICMVAVGGSQGLQAWISLIFNFGALFFAMVLMAFHLPPVLVTLVTGIIVLAMTIFFGWQRFYQHHGCLLRVRGGFDPVGHYHYSS